MPARRRAGHRSRCLPDGKSDISAQERNIMNKKLFIRIGGVLGALVLLGIVGAYVVFPLAANGKLPGQKQPTPIPVTPFANLTSAASAAAMPTAGAVSTGASSASA